MADIPGTWLDERLPSNRPEPEAAGAASIRERLAAGLRIHELHPDWPCEDWGCADVDYLLRRLDAEHARAARLEKAIRQFAYPGGDRVGRHDGDCAVYDAIQHGPCDCGLDHLLAALAVGPS